jgi:hypothetical protein
MFAQQPVSLDICAFAAGMAFGHLPPEDAVRRCAPYSFTRHSTLVLLLSCVLVLI